DRSRAHQAPVDVDPVDELAELDLRGILAIRPGTLVRAVVQLLLRELRIAARDSVAVVTGLASVLMRVAAEGAVLPTDHLVGAGDQAWVGWIAGLSGIQDPVAAWGRDTAGIRAGIAVEVEAIVVDAEESATRVVAVIDRADVVVVAVDRIAHAMVVLAP